MTILDMSLGGAVLIAVILLLRRLALYQLPKWTFLLLWGVALCRLLIPFAIPSPVSIYNGAERLAQTVEAPVSPAPPSGAAPNAAPAAPAVVPVPPPISEAPAPAEEAPEAVSPVRAVYRTGLALCALYFAAAYIWCLYRFRGAVPAEQDFIARWQAEHPTLLPVRIRVSGRLTAPLAYGPLRPVILLPRTTDWADEGRLRYVLTHEYVHIRRGDMVWKLLLAGALCVHWFNPLVWAMYFCANRDLELACDEAVVGILGLDSRKGYACTLLSAAEQGRFPLCTTYATRSHMEERIRAIMKTKKQTAAALLAALLLVAGVTAVFATSRTPEEAEQGQTNDTIRPSAVTDKPAGPVPELRADGVWLEIVEGTVTPSGLEMVLHNDSPCEVLTGEFYAVQVKKDAGWESVEYVEQKNAVVWHSIGYYLHGTSCDGTSISGWHMAEEDGQPTDCTRKSFPVNWNYLYGQLPPGTYRIFKDVTVYAKGMEGHSIPELVYGQEVKDFNVYAEFEIRADGTGAAGDTATAPEPKVPEPRPFTPGPAPDVPASPYPTNSKGHTYGRWTQADGYENVPDLIFVHWDASTWGYLRREEVYPYAYPLGPDSTQEELERYLDWYHKNSRNAETRADFLLYSQEEEVVWSCPALYLSAHVDGKALSDKALLERVAQGNPITWQLCLGTAPAENIPHDRANLGRQPIEDADEEKLFREWTENGDWRRNSRGMTYGTSALSAVVGYEPDLVLVQATNGESGFVLSHDLEYAGYPGSVSNPAGVEAYERWLKTQPGTILLPVFDAECRTVVGYFAMGNELGCDRSQADVQTSLETLANELRKWGFSEEKIAQEQDRYLDSLN